MFRGYNARETVEKVKMVCIHAVVVTDTDVGGGEGGFKKLV